MQFRGKNILETQEVNFFVENRDKFLEFCLKLCNKKKLIVNEDEIENVIGGIYDCLYFENLDEQAVKKSLSGIFKENEDFLRYLLTRSFLYLMELYLKQKNKKSISSLMNGIRKILEIFNDENYKKSHAVHTHNFIDSIIEEESMFSLHEDIVSIFSKIHQANKELEFLNLYEGICVRNFGKIIKIEDDLVTCQVPLLQILAMIEEKNAYIVKNSFTANHVKAEVEEFDISQKTVTLRNFVRLSNMPASQRIHTRVHPKKNILVTLQNDEQNLEGLMYDISKGGLALLSKTEFSCQEGDVLGVSFDLTLPKSGETKTVNLDAELIILIDFEGNYRYCLKTLPNEHEDFIAMYTDQREEETLKGLQDRLCNIKN